MRIHSLIYKTLVKTDMYYSQGRIFLYILDDEKFGLFSN